MWCREYQVQPCHQHIKGATGVSLTALARTRRVNSSQAGQLGRSMSEESSNSQKVDRGDERAKPIRLTKLRDLQRDAAGAKNSDSEPESLQLYPTWTLPGDRRCWMRGKTDGSKEFECRRGRDDGLE